VGYIFLITIDSFRADRFNKHTTPFLWKFARENIHFKNAISNAPGTPQAFKAIFMSMHPSVAGRDPYIPSYGRYLPEELSNKGYITAGFNSNPYLSSFYNYNRGYDVFEDFSTIKMWRRLNIPLVSRGLEFLINSYKDSGIINEKVMKFLNQSQKRNYFVWLHYMDVHYPYASTLWEKITSVKNLRKAKYKPNKLTKKEKRQITRLYDKRVNELDFELGNFVTFLKEKGVYEDSYILITADHGDEFGEHGDFFHGHGKLYDEMIRIPLIVKLPDSTQKVVEEQTDLVEVSPAILDQVIPQQKKYVISESFRDNKEVISVRTLNWKLIECGNDKKLYNLKKDPLERENLIGEEEDIEKELREIIENHKKTRMEKEKLNKKIQKLKDLGRI
jgi:membrane-anchored protein YejM (alkaline phosphatase superfamily)